MFRQAIKQLVNIIGIKLEFAFEMNSYSTSQYKKKQKGLKKYMILNYNQRLANQAEGRQNLVICAVGRGNENLGVYISGKVKNQMLGQGQS